MSQFVLPRQVESVAALRAMTKHRDRAHAFIRPLRDYFIFDAASVAADDGIDTIKPTDVGGAGRYIRYMSGSIEAGEANVKDFGAVGDGVADDTAAIQAAIDSGKDVVIPRGVYKVTATLTLPDRPLGITMHGGASIDASSSDFTLFSTAYARAYWISSKNVVPDFQTNGVVRSFIGGGGVGSKFFTVQAGSAAWVNLTLEGVQAEGFEKYFYTPTGCSITANLLFSQLIVPSLATAYHGECVDLGGVAIIMFRSDCIAAGGGEFGTLHGGLKGGVSLETTIDCHVTLKNAGEVSYLNLLGGNFGGGPLKQIHENEGQIIGCLFYGADPAQANWIDFTAGSGFADGTVIQGCAFTGNGSMTELIKLGAKKCRIADNLFIASAAEKTVKEVAGAQNNEISGNQGLGTGEGVVLLAGSGSRINGSREWDVIDFGADPSGAASSVDAIARALATACPSAGDAGVIYFPPGTYLVDDTISIGDVEPHFKFAKGAKLVHTGLGAKPALKFSDGLTDYRYPLFTDLETEGNDAADDSLFELNDSSSFCVPTFVRSMIQGWRTVLDIKDGDSGYVTPVIARFEGGQILSPNAASPLCKSPSGAGTYDFGMSIYFIGVRFGESSGTPTWTLDFDGDIIASGGLQLTLAAGSQVDGLELANMWLAAPTPGDTVEVLGGSYWAKQLITGVGMDAIALKLSWANYQLTGIQLSDGASLIANATGISVIFAQNSFGTPAAIAIDILAGADYCQVLGGTFLDHATAAIRTAASYGSFKAGFASTGAHKTILELMGADKNIATGCTGLHTGGGVTVVGAGSLYDVTVANVA